VKWKVRRLPSQWAELSGYDGGHPLVLCGVPPEKCIQKANAFVLCSERVNQSKRKKNV